MVSVLAMSAVDRGFEPRSSQTKDYKIDMCCFSAEHAALRRKGKDWLARNQDNVSVLGDMSIRELFQWANGQAKEEKGTTTKHYTYILFRDILSNQCLQNKWTSTLRIESDKFFLLIDRCGLPLLISVSLITVYCFVDHCVLLFFFFWTLYFLSFIDLRWFTKTILIDEIM